MAGSILTTNHAATFPNARITRAFFLTNRMNMRFLDHILRILDALRYRRKAWHTRDIPELTLRFVTKALLEVTP